MNFGLFSPSTSPIAIDFGSSSVKLLQITTGEKPSIVAAAELTIPDEKRLKPDELWAFYADELPRVIKQGRFRGKRVVCSVPGYQTIAQHVQIDNSPGVKKSSQAQMQLQMQIGAAPNSLVVRTVEVADIQRDGQARTEMICLAIQRDHVMRYVETLKKCRLEAVGVHSNALATQRAFDHIYRREGDDALTTMYIELGWGSTQVTIAHGTKLVFARSVQLGGQHFDQLISRSMNCDAAAARAHRLSLKATPSPPSAAPKPTGDPSSSNENSTGGMARLQAAMSAQQSASGDENRHASGSASATPVAQDRRHGKAPRVIANPVSTDTAPSAVADVDFTELIDTMNDELSMCVRYHRGLFPNRPIDRAILLGGESRQMWLCQQLARRLQLPARLGDPLARFARDDSAGDASGILNGQPQPGWAVPCGLCVIPTDF